MNIFETVTSEMNGNRHSFIEVYDFFTDALIYHGMLWDCPYNTDYEVDNWTVYNDGNSLLFRLWVYDEDTLDWILSEEEEETTDIESGIIEEEEEEEEEEETSFFYELCNNNLNEDVYLIVNDISFGIELYKGLAKLYPYNWDIEIQAFAIETENDKIFIKVWCNYPYIII